MRALFRRIVPLHEAIAVIRGFLHESDGTPLPVDLQELSASLRRREAPPPAALLDWPPQPLVEALPEAAGLIEAGCRLAAGNAALDSMLSGRTVGRTVLQATRSDELHEMVARALEGLSDRRELALPALENKIVSAVAAPLPAGRALLVLRDLTAQKLAEAVRRDFIANASHELRTPVSAISAAAEMLLEAELDENARRFVEMISRHAVRLSRLTSDLLDLSRLEAGQWPIELGTYEAIPICAAALQFVRERAEAKRIDLGGDVPERLQIRCDARALEQILVNLLDNAIKYTPEGGRVTLLADAAGSQVILSVLDTGPGIEARHQQRIFERFFRVDGGRARSDGGSGLGLAIVKHLAQAQGGEAGVESGRGGSRFWVRLPAAA